MLSRVLTFLLSGLLAALPTQDPFAASAGAYLLKYVAGGGGLNTTRATTARYHDVSGVVQTAAINTARESHYDGGTRELLVEPASTNQWIASQDFTNAAWTLSGYNAVAADTIVAPDGTTTAEALIPAASAGNHTISQTLPALTDNNPQSVSVYAKAAGYNYLLITTRSKNATTLNQTLVDLSTGTVATTGAGHTVRVIACTSSWYRVELSFNVSTGATSPLANFCIRPDNATTSFTGDGTSGGYLWGAQFEKDTYWPTSYIATTTATVSRSADNLYLDFTAVPQEMTVLIDYRDAGGWFSGNTTRFNIGNGVSPYLELRSTGGPGGNTVHLNGGAVSSASTVGASTGSSTRVEDRVVLGADGSVRTGSAVNGGAETLSAASAGLALAGTWSAQRMYLGSRAGSNGAPLAFRKVVIAASTQSLATMRSL